MPPKKRKKAPVKKTTVAKKATVTRRIKTFTERQTKSAMTTHIAEATELSRKQVQAIFDELSDLIEGHIKKRGCGEFVLPGLLKINTVKKPAKKARKGINPFTGEETMFKAKPASIQVKVRPLKKLKEMAAT